MGRSMSDYPVASLGEIIQAEARRGDDEVCHCQCVFCRVLPEHTLTGTHPRHHGFRCQVTHQEQLAHDVCLFGLLGVGSRREANRVLKELQREDVR
jgi:hypothetical protein